VEWTVGGKDLPIRNGRDAVFKEASVTRFEDLTEVDVVLFQDFRPSGQHAVWCRDSVEAIVWCNRGLRGKEKLPRGWSLTTKRLEHSRAGGVTNVTATVYIALRLGKPRVRWKQIPDCFENTLRQIIDPTKGGYMCDEPREGEPTMDTAKGLLNWQTRLTATIILPTVYSRERWARRRLSLKELGHASDIPRVRLGYPRGQR
jgi:hypothetical protein